MDEKVEPHIQARYELKERLGKGVSLNLFHRRPAAFHQFPRQVLQLGLLCANRKSLAMTLNVHTSVGEHVGVLDARLSARCPGRPHVALFFHQGRCTD